MQYGNYFCTKETYCVSVTALLRRGDGLVNKFMGDFGVSEEIPDQQTTYLKQRRMFEVCMPLSHFKRGKFVCRHYKILLVRQMAAFLLNIVWNCDEKTILRL